MIKMINEFKLIQKNNSIKSKYDNILKITPNECGLQSREVKNNISITKGTIL